MKIPTEAAPLPRTLRLGILGAGQISHTLVPMLKSFNVQVTDVADISAEAAQTLAAKAGNCSAHQSPEALLEKADVDLVYIATPPFTHRALLQAAVAAGTHVICEKPFMLNAQETRLAVADLAPHSHLKVGCCSSRFRFTPTTRAAHQILRDGTLGRLRQIRLFTTHSPPRPIDATPSWKSSAKLSGGGLVADWGVYEIEWLRATLGQVFEPVTVSAQLNDWKREGTDLECGYDVHLRCASGLDIYLTRQPQVGPNRQGIEIRGENGGMNLAFAPGSGEPARLFLTSAESPGYTDCAVSEAATSWEEVLCGPIVNVGHAVQSGAAVVSSAESQIVVHEVLDAILSSGRSGEMVKLFK